jgi:hypothetical protein
MSMGKKTLLYSALASMVLVLAPAAAAAAAAGVPAVRAGTDVPPGYVTESFSGIGLPTGSIGAGEVSCPMGTVVLSGGAYTAGGVRTGLNQSLPEGAHEWFVLVNNYGNGPTTFNVYAVCAKRPKGYVQLSGSNVNNPAGDQTSATEDCPTGDVIIGGGDSAAAVESPSIDMTSSYPNGLASWTVAESNFSTGDETFNVVAICAKTPPHYAIFSTSASDPAGAQVGIIQDCTAPEVVLGGGNQSSNTTNLRIGIKTTQPFPASGTGWKSGENNDTSAGTTLTSYAICAT